ncbi:hypothetical protein FHS15_001612 [Paenibacillus castaneae]|uniref:GNAT family N-acetyltransferase n=1 Tax=Paenibacillus castaneae TaxID=474957 RepID=UPI000C9C3043|nr:GNAT family N-acetyltransferase [Paenibacillus castaneae]NIK76487.1 hypothetical protein [Paenibacillus castaneae]
MLENLVQNDPVFGGKPFLSNEVQYNLVHRITESEHSLCLKTPDGQMIFTQTPGHNGWLWISKEVNVDEEKAMMKELIDHLKDHRLSGVTGDIETAKKFAQDYSKINNLHYDTKMNMESYFCPIVKKPTNVRGEIQRAMSRDIEIVAQFMAGFSEGAYGISVDPKSQRPAAMEAIDAGNLYLWIVDGFPVSMANIAHRSPRHGRINAVFTPPSMRKKGYASAIVAELCLLLEREHLIPMLYADLTNPDSNKVYKNIGFVEGGQIMDIRFSAL